MLNRGEQTAEAVTGPGGRLQIGMVAGIKSERWPASNRNPRPDCVGIRSRGPPAAMARRSRPARLLGFTAAVGEAHHPVRLGDIDVMRIRTRRRKGDAERAMEPGGEGRGARGFGRAVGTLSTVTRPAALSATKTSPFGATRMTRGSLSPEANRLTAKPSSALAERPRDAPRPTTDWRPSASRPAPACRLASACGAPPARRCANRRRRPRRCGSRFRRRGQTATSPRSGCWRGGEEDACRRLLAARRAVRARTQHVRGRAMVSTPRSGAREEVTAAA